MGKVMNGALGRRPAWEVRVSARVSLRAGLALADAALAMWLLTAEHSDKEHIDGCPHFKTACRKLPKV